MQYIHCSAKVVTYDKQHKAAAEASKQNTTTLNTTMGS